MCGGGGGGGSKNKNKHIYIAPARKVIICRTSMLGISRGQKGLCICLHIYASGKIES